MMIINNNNFRLYYGDALTVLKESLSSESVDCVITSPDNWQLRGDTDILPGEIGLEEKFTEYMQKVLAVFNEVHRVLKPKGTFFIVINDSYNTPKIRNTNGIPTSRGRVQSNRKPECMNMVLTASRRNLQLASCQILRFRYLSAWQ